jgi:hemerythrin superfamily protein
MANHENAIDARATFITLMLREDHQNLKELFDRFGNTTNHTEQQNIVTAALAALEVHATLEEELIYPAWQEQVDAQGLTDKALAEHHVVHVLINELKEINPEDESYNAKFMLLSEHVTHHINEEEGKMFPQAEKADVDWDRLTKHVIERRQSLEQKTLWLLGVPVIVSAREPVSATRGVLSCRPGPSLASDPARR